MSNQKLVVAIITGNSNSGSACIEELYDRYADKVTVRAGFRTEDKAQPFKVKYPQLEVHIGLDATKPESMNSLFKGAHSALIVSPHDPSVGIFNDASRTLNMINTAVDNGVKYAVLVGAFTNLDCEIMTILSAAYKPPEDLLAKLGKDKNIKWTVLRGGFFMENTFFMFKDSLKNTSTISFPNFYYPMIDTKDIGKCGAACLASDGSEHNEKFYDMNGPEMLTGQDIAAVFSRVLQKEIKYTEMSMDFVRKNLPPYMVQIYEYMYVNGKKALPFTDDVKKLTGQHGNLEQFVTRHKNAFI